MGSIRVSAAAVTLVALLAVGVALASGKPTLLDTLAPGPPTEGTFPHNDQRLAAIGKSILIAEGHTPRGLPYELVAYAAKPSPGEEASVGGVRKATCLDMDYPSTGQAPGASRVCFGGNNFATLHVSGLSSAPGSAAKSGYVVSGETRPRVAAVAVTYQRHDGERVTAGGSYGLITDRVARAADIRYRAGEFVAFLPAGVVQPDDPIGSLEGSLEVTAYDRDGKVLDRDTFGDG